MNEVPFPIGSRVEDTDGYKATVMYVGPVAASKNKGETWLGVEWDDKTRGKHDGSCFENGIMYKYFHCPNGAGSFVKPTKVKLAISLAEALNDRYVTMDAPEITSSNSVLAGAFVSTAKGNVKQIEFVGERKLRKYQQLSLLTKITIRNARIGYIPDNVADLLPQLVEIDLQDNLLWQWIEIFKLAEQVPSLMSIQLQGNKFEPLSTELALQLPKTSLATIRRLALNKTGLSTWAQIERLEQFLPQVEELYVADNDLWDLPLVEKGDEIAESSAISALASIVTVVAAPYVRGFTHLRILDLSSCRIEQWSQIHSLGKLAVLEQLILDDNPLEQILPALLQTFLNLKRLSISATKVCLWNSITHLASYSQLDQLRISHIPLFMGLGASEVRPLVIGRVSRLTVLNGSTISSRERRDAEKLYLKSILRQAIKLAGENDTNTTTNGSYQLARPTNTFKPENMDPRILEEHPRYPELLSIHGEDLMTMLATANESGPHNIAAELITLTFRNCSASGAVGLSRNGPTGVQKRLPASLTVGKIKLICQTIFGVDTESQELSLATTPGDPFLTLLSDDDTSLSYYGAVDGSEILVGEK